MLDLSALESNFDFSASRDEIGKPLLLALELIDEDPNQPRKEFDEGKLRELADDIKIRGIKQPVSVRTHPTDAGRWMLNFGARRYRASKLAGMAEIPAFVDESADDYAQVAENEQRENLSPMSIALFIDKKLKEGVKKKEIAKQVGKSPTVITEYLSLLTAPACIESVYREGRTTSVRTLFELASLHKNYPEQVESWIANVEQDITRRSIADFGESLRNSLTLLPETEKKGALPDVDVDAEPQKLRHNEVFVDGNNDADIASVCELPYHNPEIGKDQKPLPLLDTTVLKKPLLLGVYGNRAVMLLLNRRPSKDGLVFVRYEDSGQDDEVDITQVTLSLLISMS